MQALRNIVIITTLLLSSFILNAESWEHLYDDAKYQNAKISPNGEYIAAAMNHNNKTILLFLKREDMSIAGSAQLGGSYDVGNYHWVNNERVVIEMVKRVPWREKPLSYGELYSVNYDGTHGKVIYGYQAGEKQLGTRFKRKKSIYGWASIIDILPEDEKHILIESTPMNDTGDRLSSVFKLNVYTGVIKKRLGRSPIPYSHFVTNIEGEIKAVTGTDSSGTKQLYLKNNGLWEKIPDGIVGQSVSLISISASGKYLYTRDNPNQDIFGIFRLNLENFKYDSLYTDKHVDVTDVELTTNGRSAYAIRIDDGYPAYLMLNKDIEEGKIFKNLLTSFPFSAVNITSKTEDGNFYIVMVSSDIDPGSLYLFDKQKNKLSLLFKFRSEINSNELLQIEPIQVVASDGVKINSYFTQAKSKKKDKLAPVVVVVHGGPHGIRDYWHYSNNVQYLALNGFSVLQVNYRGSGGYGENFETSGHKVWGSKIQQDIYESYQWLVSQKKAEADNVCIMGGSFGGYSAVQSATLYPETYKCAVANAGVYDLTLILEEDNSRAVKSFWIDALGTDKDKLKTISPVNYAEKIKVPLLLAHGKDDEIAPFEHVESLRESLDKANKPYEWYVVEKEGHGFYNPENQKAYMKKVVSFLGQHLK